MNAPVKAPSIFDHISALVAEEVMLRDRSLAPLADGRRIRFLQAEVDECWDLLREQRARQRPGSTGRPGH